MDRPSGSRLITAALAVVVGLVLADSSVVVLALPEIYRQLDVSVSAVAWVLIAFNLVLACAAVPFAFVARRTGAARSASLGLVVFAAGSVGCAASGAIAPLIASRCVQALGGAAAVTSVLELMPPALGSERRAATLWATAGALGAALGPAAGGALTQLVSWESIFWVQVPVALVLLATLLPSVRRERGAAEVLAEPVPAGRPHLAANLALCLVSAALAAALFLIVLLLIEGWRHSPIAAAIAVSAMPAAALASRPLARTVADGRARAIAGAVLVAGGLAGLGLLPRASIVATLPSQLLVGVGLGLVLSALTEAALEGRAPQAIHGGWTLTARHAGVVLGLLVLTPVFTSDLVHERSAAEQAGTAALLDSPLPPLDKIDLAGRLHDVLATQHGKVPVIGAAFRPLPSDPIERRRTLSLEATMQDQLDRAATHAFSASFLIASGFALAALAGLALARARIEL